MSAMTPQEIVSELDRHIVGQANAKRAVAIALRNRWRRQQVVEPMRGEITRNLGLAHAGGADHQDVLRRDFAAQFFVDLLAPPTVAQRDGDGALGVRLTDDVAV